MSGSPRHLFYALCCLLFALGMGVPDAALGQEKPEGRSLRVIFFGQTQGVSAHLGLNGIHRFLYGEVGHGMKSLKPIAEGPLTLARGGSLLFSETPVTLDSFRDFLGDAPHRTELVNDAFPIYNTPYEQVIEWSADGKTPILDRFSASTTPPRLGERVPGYLFRVSNASGKTFYLLQHRVQHRDQGPSVDLVTDPDGYEIRFALYLEATPAGGPPRTVINFGKPFHEGARRSLVIKTLQEEAPGETLLLSAGDDVETWSFIDPRKPDLQRPHSWASFGAMGLDVMSPGPRELAFGIETLLEEAKAHGVKLVATNLGDPRIPTSVSMKRGGLDILVLGLLDPQAAVVTLGEAISTISPAAVAACSVIEKSISERGSRPDLVVAMGQLGFDTRRTLSENCPHIDLFLARFDDLGVASQVADIRLDGSERRLGSQGSRMPIPVLSPGRKRLGFVDIDARLQKESAAVDRIHSAVVGVPGDLAADPKMARLVQATRLAAYAPAQVELLPPLGEIIDSDGGLRARFDAEMGSGSEGLPAHLTPGLWRALIGGVLAETFAVDVVAVSPLQSPWVLAGAVSRLEAAANLNVPYRLVLVTASKKDLVAWASTMIQSDVEVTGFDAKSLKIGGRALDDRVRYHVLLSEDLLSKPGFEKLSVRPQTWRFHRSSGGYVADSGGEEVTLREAAMRGLEQRGRVGSEALADVWRLSTGPKSRWVIDLDGLNLTLNRVGRSGASSGYDAVRETRVNTAANHQVAVGGVVGLGWQSAPLTWMNALEFDYAKAWYDEADDQETADALGFSTELQVDRWALPTVGAIPFVQGAFATEFTPTDGEDGPNPRKLQADGVAGFLWRGAIIKSARLGALTTRDFASEVDDVQAGVLGQVEAKLPLPIGKWANTLEVRYYFPGVGEEDESELSLRAQGRSAVEFPLVGPLSLSAFVDVFGYRGQVSPALDPGLSVMSGLALSIDQLIPLNRF